MASYPGDDLYVERPHSQQPFYYETPYTDSDLAQAAADWMHKVTLAKEAKERFFEIASDLQVREFVKYDPVMLNYGVSFNTTTKYMEHGGILVIGARVTRQEEPGW